MFPRSVTSIYNTMEHQLELAQPVKQGRIYTDTGLSRKKHASGRETSRLLPGKGNGLISRRSQPSFYAESGFFRGEEIVSYRPGEGNS